MSAEEEPGYRDWQGPITYHVSDSVPSRGSSSHADGTCRPCAWFHKPDGCRNAQDCPYCHLCPANAKRKSKGHGKAKGDGKGRRIEEEVVALEAEPVPPIDPTSGTRWSRGSELHGMPGKQRCRPCLFLWTSSGCPEGEDCEYCHICVPEQFLQPPPPPPGGPAERQPMPQPVLQPVLQPVAAVATAPVSSGPGGPGTMAIQLADRIQEPPPLPAVPSVTVATVVLGTAPPTMGRPLPAGPPRVPPGTLRPPPREKCNSMVSQFQMGLLEGMYCDNCGAQLCICFPGGFGFSQQPLRGEANGYRNGAGGVPGRKSGEELRGQENEVPQTPLCSGRCTPCLEMIQYRYCSNGDSCQFCHQCLDRRKTKKIGNMSLKKSQKVGDNANVCL